MSRLPTDPDTPDSANIDPGEPVKELAGFQEEMLVGLVARVRRSIYRRTATAHVTSFWWSTPLLILSEFWTVLVGQFSSKGPRKDT